MTLVVLDPTTAPMMTILACLKEKGPTTECTLVVSSICSWS